MKKKVIIIIILITILSLGMYFINKTRINNGFPQLILKGNHIINIEIDSKYIEDGFIATDNLDGDISKKVKIRNNLNISKIGSYVINYEVINSKGIKVVTKRFVNVLNKPIYIDKYNNVNNNIINWGTSNQKNERPFGDVDIDTLRKYNAYYIGNDDKTIYLTFDEGSNNTYLEKIVTILNKNNVKGTFFLCKRFILDNKDLINNLVLKDHLVGNHTATHPIMATYANEDGFSRFLRELKNTELAFTEVTNKNMPKVFRFPSGSFSYRSMEILKDLGYKTYFWSAAYNDYGNDVNKTIALQELKDRLHNGAIYLLHPKNKGNYEAIDAFIKYAKNKGYKFDIVSNIVY